MESKFTKFQQYIRQNPILVSAAAIAQIIFICLIVFIATNVNANTYIIPNLEVSNLKQSLENLPDNAIDPIQSALYDAVTLNGGTLSSIEASDTEIRDNSVHESYFENINMHYISAIVDIPSIEQSYQIFNEWSDDSNNPYFLTDMATMIMCPTEEQVIYNDFNCRDKFAHNGQKIIISSFIKYFNFEYFTVFANPNDYSIININPASLDADNATKEFYIQETKNAISSLGISPDLFKYRIIQKEDYNYKLEPY